MAFFLDIFHGTMVVKGVVMKVTEKIERRFLLKEIPYDLENQECINIKQEFITELVIIFKRRNNIHL